MVCVAQSKTGNDVTPIVLVICTVYCPVFVHLSLQLPCLRTPGPVCVHQQNKIFPRKRLTQTDYQPLCCMLIVFSLRKKSA